MRVTFFLDALGAQEDLDGLRRLDPDRDWRSFQRGEQVWVLQTYLRLARAGRPVELAAMPPGEGLIVFHAKQARALRRQRHLLGDAVLVLAVRPEGRSTNKPASKLVNAWLAGVPALLGPEIAYRELRRSELDYCEVSSLAEAQAAVDRLLGDPGLYNAMVENGRARA